MGMYTTIVAKDGRGFQIKCGRDLCDKFNVGDTVPWFAAPDCPGDGYLLDGVYSGLGGTRGDWKEVWIIIKDHVILEPIPLKEGRTPETLKEEFEIQDPSRDLWTEKAWEDQRKRQETLRAELVAYQAGDAHLPPKKRIVKAMSRYLQKHLSEGHGGNWDQRYFDLFEVRKS